MPDIVFQVLNLNLCTRVTSVASINESKLDTELTFCPSPVNNKLVRLAQNEPNLIQGSSGLV